MSGINIGTAFLQLVPSFDGSRQASERAGQQMGQSAAEQFGNQFSRDTQGRLHDERGRFIREFTETGQQAGEAAGGSFGGSFGDSVGGFFSGTLGNIIKGGLALGAIKELGEAAGAAFSGTFGEAMERQAAVTKAGVSIGLSPAESKEMGATAGKLYAQAYGDSFEGVTDALSLVKSSLKGLGGDELEGATKKALSFSQAFGVDVERSVSSVSTLLGSGLVGSADEAFDLLTKASQKVPAALREDVLDASDEYSQFFRTLGFDGSEAFGALAAASDKGVFGIDKTGDAIKEFTIRATDMSTTSVAAFQALGLDAQTMADDILAGGDTAQGATQKIIDGLLGIQDPATQANTAIALFGTPLEDLGVQDIPKFLSSLDDATGGLGDFAGAAADVDATLGNTIQSKWTSLTRTIEGFGPTLSAAFLPIIGPILDGLTGIATSVQGAFQTASDDITGFFAGFNRDTDADLTENQTRWSIWGGAVRDAVQGPLNFVGSYVKDARAALSTLFTGDFDPSQWFSAPEEDSALVDFLFTIRDTVKETFGQIFDTLGQVWNELGPSLMDAFKEIWGAVKPLIPTFLELFQAFNPVGLLFKALLPVLPQLAGIVGDLAKVLADGVARALDAVAPLFQTVVDVINRLLPFVTKLVESLLPPLVSLFDKVAPLLDAILGALLPVVDAIVAALIPAIDAIMPIVERVFTFIADTIGNIVQVFSGVIDFITGVFTGNWEQVWTGIQEIFGGIWNQIKNIFSTLWDVMVDFFTTLGPKLWEIVTGLAGQLAQWGGQFLGWIWQGIQDLWNGTIWPWCQALPGNVWAAISAAAGQLVAWGEQFLQWIWDGITAKATDVWDWFTSLPSTIWGYVAASGQWVIDRGGEFIGWITQGVKDGASDLWQWVIGLPAKVWEFLSNLKTVIANIGKDFVGWIVDGIKGAAQAVADAVTSLFNLQLNESGTGYVSVGVVPGEGGIPLGGSRGAVVPGRDPGRRDNILGRLPSGAGFGLRSEEAIMVPEFTHAVGGEPGVHMLNRLAEQGRIGEVLGGFARGGVVSDAKLLGQDAVEGIASGIRESKITGLFGRIVKDVLDSATAAIASMSTGGVDPDTARGKFIAAMLSKQGTSYVWGAAGPDVFDCSGLVSWALEQAGVGKGRLTAEGFNSSFPKGAEIPGNLVTFDTGRLPGQAGHIGAIVDATRGLMMHTDGAGPARVSDYRSRDGGPLNIVDAIGDGGAARIAATFTGILSGIKGMISTQLNNAIGPSGETPGGTGVERWRGIVDQALTMTGQPTSLDGYVLHQMDTESSGNQAAINNYDSNARRGTPSKGLMQVIDPTFRTYALPGFNTNIWDPLSNIIASIRYVLARYGSIPAGMQGHAYDSGGLFPGGSVGFNFLAQPEAVLTPPETEAYQQVAAALASGDLGGPSAPMLHVERMEILRGTPEDIVDEMLWRVA